MVAHIAAETDGETRRWRRNDGNEMAVKFTFFLTDVGHLGHHILTPAAGSSYPGPHASGIAGSLAGGIGGPLHRNTHNHTFGFGWTWHDEIQRYLPDEGNISGTATFNSLATSLENPNSGNLTSPATHGNTGFDAANFFLGDAATY